MPSLKGTIHSCLTQDISTYVLLVDQFAFHHIDLKKGNHKVYVNQNCQGLHVVGG
jgi:hypothetical protein